MTYLAYGVRSPCSHYDVILIMTPFTTELATPSVTDECTYVRTDTLPRLIDKDTSDKLECGPMPNVMAALPNIGGALCSTPQSLADAHY